MPLPRRPLLRAPLEALPPLPLLLPVHRLAPRADARHAQVAVELLHRVQERIVRRGEEDRGAVFLVQRVALGHDERGGCGHLAYVQADDTLS